MRGDDVADRTAIEARKTECLPASVEPCRRAESRGILETGLTYLANRNQRAIVDSLLRRIKSHHIGFNPSETEIPTKRRI